MDYVIGKDYKEIVRFLKTQGTNIHENGKRFLMVESEEVLLGFRLNNTDRLILLPGWARGPEARAIQTRIATPEMASNHKMPRVYPKTGEQVL